MTRRLPPLTALRAFEAAARLGSFTRAANELHVTQAAISHQVKILEEWLSLRLFERHGHSLSLTQAGKSYLPQLSKALDIFASATGQLLNAGEQGALRVTALPSFASRWLAPRLARFRTAHPGIDVHVTSALEPYDFSSGTYDAAIRLGQGRWPGLRADLIAHEYLSPLCSPELQSGAYPLHTPDDLQFQTLLHDQPRDAWQRWLDGAGAGNLMLADRGGLSFTDSALVLQAAVAGQGVAIGRLFLASDDLAAKRLVRPFSHQLQNDFSYWLVYPKASADLPRVALFRSWLLAEAGASAAAIARQ